MIVDASFSMPLITLSYSLAASAIRSDLSLSITWAFSPEALKAQVMLKLKSLRMALAAKEYDKVISGIEKEASTIIEPADQAEALLMFADAKAGKAGDDKNAWKDVAVAYMRVAANAPGTAQAATALLKVAAIHETRLGEKDTALRLLKQIATDYKGQESGNEAEA